MEVTLTAGTGIVVLLAGHLVIIHEFTHRVRVSWRRLALFDIGAVGCAQAVVVLYAIYVDGRVEDIVSRLLYAFFVGMVSGWFVLILAYSGWTGTRGWLTTAAWTLLEAERAEEA